MLSGSLAILMADSDNSNAITVNTGGDWYGSYIYDITSSDFDNLTFDSETGRATVTKTVDYSEGTVIAITHPDRITVGTVNWVWDSPAPSNPWITGMFNGQRVTGGLHQIATSTLTGLGGVCDSIIATATAPYSTYAVTYNDGDNTGRSVVFSFEFVAHFHSNPVQNIPTATDPYYALNVTALNLSVWAYRVTSTTTIPSLYVDNYSNLVVEKMDLSAIPLLEDYATTTFWSVASSTVGGETVYAGSLRGNITSSGNVLVTSCEYRNGSGAYESYDLIPGNSTYTIPIAMTQVATSHDTIRMAPGQTYSYTPTFSLQGGTLSIYGVDWLTLNNGTISGTAPNVTATEKYSLVIEYVTENPHQVAIQTATFIVSVPLNITLSASTMYLVTGKTVPNTAGEQVLCTATGPSGGTYTWSIDGTNDSGVTLSANGVFGGTPGNVGTYTITVKCVWTDGEETQTDTETLTIVIVAVLAFTSTPSQGTIV